MQRASGHEEWTRERAVVEWRRVADAMHACASEPSKLSSGQY